MKQRSLTSPRDIVRSSDSPGDGLIVDHMIKERVSESVSNEHLKRSTRQRIRAARPIKFLLRSSALATICGICASVGFIYGAHVVNRVHQDEFAAMHAELATLQQQQGRVATQSAFLKTVFDDLVTSNEQMRQIQDAPQPRRRQGRAWYAIGGGMEPRAPIIDPSERRIKSSDAEAVIGHSTLSVRGVQDRPEIDPSIVIERWARIFEALPLGIPVDGYISSPYGRRVSPTSGRWQLHAGIDFAVDQATNVVATGQGVVRQAGYRGAYGLSVTIDHGNGWQTVYGHLSAIRAKVGQRICRGQTLGHVGSTGNSTGPHLHYEVRKANVPRNPAPFVEFPRIARTLLGLFR